MEGEQDEYVPFSVREGIVPRKAIQWRSMDEGLKNGLWNALTMSCWHHLRDRFSKYGDSERPNYDHVAEQVWTQFLNNTLDKFPDSKERYLSVVRRTYFSMEWNQILDLIEFTIRNMNSYYRAKLIQLANSDLKRHNSAYRIVLNKVIPITSESEIEEIERAIENASNGPLITVAIHLRSALECLARRDDPEYRNSIKESISAVESLCKLIAGATSGVLRQALTTLVQRHQLAMHPQFRTALENLYNFTSDAEGIRHALMDEPTLDAEDARFMLVACSAFVNYLIVKADKAGISLTGEGS